MEWLSGALQSLWSAGRYNLMEGTFLYKGGPFWEITRRSLDVLTCTCKFLQRGQETITASVLFYCLCPGSVYCGGSISSVYLEMWLGQTGP